MGGEKKVLKVRTDRMKERRKEIRMKRRKRKKKKKRIIDLYWLMSLTEDQKAPIMLQIL